MLAALMTFTHLSLSDSKNNAARSSVPPITVKASVCHKSWRLGARNISSMSRLSFATIDPGTPEEVAMVNQPVPSNPAIPSSSTVGISGS
jgi:hypothetical protein